MRLPPYEVEHKKGKGQEGTQEERGTKDERELGYRLQGEESFEHR